MQHWPTGFPDPQKHFSISPQQAPYIFPEPQLQFAITFAFCFSSIILKLIYYFPRPLAP